MDHKRRQIIKSMAAMMLGGPMLMLNSCGRKKLMAADQGVFLKNENLETIKKGYAGNFFQDGRFSGKYTSGAGKTVWRILRWKLSTNPRAEEKQNDPFKLKVIEHHQIPESMDDYIMWLGHAGFLIHVNGKTIIIDPCLTSPPLVPRLAPLPVDMKKIQPDYLLISHGHYDHLDADTIEVLPGGRTKALVPLKMGSIISDINRKMPYEEAGWYQKYNIDDGIEIFLLPAHHWHKRSPFDLNNVLWGSYLIRWNNKTIYFAGDSAMSTHFAEIGRLFGKIDYALLPIGSYEPAYIMKTSHMNPGQAVKAFHDLNGRVFIPMHYGTFDLTDEPLGDPLRRLNKLVKKGRVNGTVQIPDVGTVLKV